MAAQLEAQRAVEALEAEAAARRKAWAEAEAQAERWVVLGGAAGPNAETVNGRYEATVEREVYRKAGDASTWLFVTKTGKWMVGATADKDARKTRSSGWAHTVAPAGGRPPPAAAAVPWNVLCGKGDWREQALRVELPSAVPSAHLVDLVVMSSQASEPVTEHVISPEELKAKIEAAQHDLRVFYDQNINQEDAIAIFQEQGAKAVASAEAMFARAVGRQASAPIVTALWKAASGDQEEKRMEFSSSTVFGRLPTANFFMNVNHTNISRMNFIVVPMTTGQVAIVWYGGIYKLQVSISGTPDHPAITFGVDCDILKVVDAAAIVGSEVLIELTSD
eukprot:SAG11_NODE_8534_length_1004_cov_1.662983_1_plen_334_part_11